MESITLTGLLKIRVKRGSDLAVRDILTSDPYVVVSLAHQKWKTRVVKNNCNPEWNDERTLSIADPNIPINLTVYDKDMITADDKMGEAEVDIKPYMDVLEKRLENLPTPTPIARIQPSRDNCLAVESSIVWEDGKIYQDMVLGLRNVERGKVEVRLEWIHVPDSSRRLYCCSPPAYPSGPRGLPKACAAVASTSLRGVLAALFRRRVSFAADVASSLPHHHHHRRNRRCSPFAVLQGKTRKGGEKEETENQDR
ncbi:hypothetical protein NL676_037952 [Syzygium grande]|nr:hypothetical protein NL676_037952 [Syzygium grande]